MASAGAGAGACCVPARLVKPKHGRRPSRLARGLRWAAGGPGAISCVGRLDEKATPGEWTGPKVIDDTVVEPRGVMDFVEQARELVRCGGGGGGPPRWFSPLECGSRREGSPLLLFLPGVDGTGLGLVRHHQRLGKIFDIWCLHIPPMDRTPFEGLVGFVERTVNAHASHCPNKPIYLVGESLGACLALAVVARNPDVDIILVLANPATALCKSPFQPLFSFLEFIPEEHVDIPFYPSSISEGWSPHQILGALPDSITVTFLYISFLVDIIPRESLLWRLKMLRSAYSYTSSRLHSVKVQTLVLASGKDQLLPSREEAERLCDLLPNCRIRHFNDSGHNILLESGFDLVTVIKGSGFYRRSRRMDYVSDYLLPTPPEVEKVVEEYRWVNVTTDPVMLSTLSDGKIVRHLSGVPSEGPAILVGYHMLMGWELGPLVSTFMAERGILLRGVAHPFMFDRSSELLMPDSSSFDSMRLMGAVPVSAVNFYKLLSRRSFVLLYPGGAREALHRKGEEYKLFWPEQSEFIRMAARFGATIIPFGVVGEDDICQLVLDYDDLVKIPFYDALLERINQAAVRLRTDSPGEVGNQHLYLPGMLPKIPGRFYFLFGRPIETRGRKELRDKEKAHELYLHVKSEVESCIAYLKDKREKDPYRNLFPRLLYQATHGFLSKVPTFDL
uniref:Acyltransferase-like protein At1g54570, chloroplastic n=1 Tax=Anthurium amnicola TaxID=1678845 RepID=A0A1D1Z7I1_9ARAE